MRWPTEILNLGTKWWLEGTQCGIGVEIVLRVLESLQCRVGVVAMPVPVDCENLLRLVPTVCEGLLRWASRVEGIPGIGRLGSRWWVGGRW